MQFLRIITRAGLVVALAGGTIVGCSSGYTTTSKASTTTAEAPTTITKAPSTTRPTTPASAPKEAAIALARRMLDAALLPPEASRTRASRPAVIRTVVTPVPGTFESVHRSWTVNETPASVDRWLEAHLPRVGGTTKSSLDGGRGILSWGIETYPLRRLALNINEAELYYGIAPDAAGRAFVRVEAQVGWTEPRPADEFISARDRVVIVTVAHSFKSGSPVSKRVVTSAPEVVQPIVRAFNRLRIESNSISSCPMTDARTVSYRVAFASSSDGTPDVVVTIRACGGVSVTVGGRAAPSLSRDPAFYNAVARVLGFSKLNFR